MNSLPTIQNDDVQKLNQKQYLDLLSRVDPEVYLIKVALIESGVNAYILPSIIRTIGNLALGTGHGKIQIFMQARVITNIKPEESVVVNEPATTSP